MSSFRALCLILGSCILLPGALSSQRADTVVVTVRGTPAAPQLKVPETFKTSGDSVNTYPAEGRFFDFQCEATLDCTLIKATAKQGSSTPKSLVATTRTKVRSVLFLDALPEQRVLQLTYESGGAVLATVTANVAAARRGKNPDATPVSIPDTCFKRIPSSP
jgi:hypothetical protein